MLKKLLITIGFISILAACSLPGQQPTPDPVIVENIVAMTLTAEYQESELQSPTPIVLSPTPTLQLPTETSTPEATATTTATQTVTATQPLPDSGIKESLGNPTWRNTLDDGVAFGLDEEGYQDDNTQITIENGAMVLSNSSIYGFRGWRLTVQSPENIYLEAEINVQACAGQDMYGLVFRAPDYESGQGYYLGITCDGEYNVTKWTESGTAAVITTTKSDQIKAGPGQTNLIGVQMTGSDFSIYINNAFVTQFTDTSFTEGGHFGVFIAGQSPSDFTIRVEEIAYWNLD